MMKLFNSNVIRKNKRVNIRNKLPTYLGSTFLGLLITSLPLSYCYAETVTGIDLINNTSINSDYKLEDKDIDKIVKNLPITSVIKETLDNNAGRQINVNNKELSYLIEKNIVSRDNVISATPDGFSISKRDINIDSDMSKSDFLMGLYKSVYGPINSRPLYHRVASKRTVNGVKGEVVETSTYRPKGYSGEAKTFTFPEGDYDVYVSPNVKELYLHELENKSIINSSDVLYDLNPTDKDWSNTAPPTEGLPDVFGRSFNVANADGSLNVSPVDTDYFVNEKITTLEALKLVESVLRLTEKDLSEKEAKIISYKYGTSYLLELPKEIRGSIIYLIALGVIDFEDTGEYGNLYQELNSEFAYKLMYRLANKSGRKDFSKVVMTADDNYFMDNGFVEQRVNVYKEFDKPVPETTEVKLDGNVNENMLDDEDTSNASGALNGGTVEIAKVDKPQAPSFLTNFLNKIGIKKTNRDFVYAAPNGDSGSYKIVKVFQDTQNIRYKGVRICDLNAERQKPEKKDKFKEVVDMSGGATDTVVTFKITAPTAVQAVASVDSRITITDNSAKHDGNVNTITQVDVNGEKVSYISSKELQNKLSEISVINSKTLKNNKTGDMAVLLTDHKIALVGNTIIRSKGDMVRKINNIEYYNMDIVVPLMTNAFLSKIDPGKLYVTKKLPKERILPVYGAGSTPIEFTPVVNTSDILSGGYDKTGDGKYMFNCNLLTRGVSTLIRDFDINNGGNKSTAKVVIDWSYCLPDNEDVMKALTKNTEKNKFTVKGASEFLMRRQPGTGQIQDWWDNNIGISNALANAMYGSQNNGIQYVKSGYLAPSVYILTTDKTISEDDLVKQIFKDIRYPQGYRSKFMDNAEGTDFVKYLFNAKDAKGKPLSTRRTFQVFRGNNSDGITQYSNRFVSTQTKAVYRAFDSDPRVRLITSGEKAGINILSRTQELSKNDTGKKVEFNGYNYVIDGYSGTSKDGSYYRLKPTKPLVIDSENSGSLKKKDNQWTMVDDKGKDLIDKFVQDRTKGITNGALRWDKIPKANRNLTPNDSWVRGNKRTMNKAQIIIGGKVKRIELKDKSTGVNYAGMKDSDVDKSGNTFCYPTLYISRTDFVVNDGKLVPKRTHPYLEQGNVFYSGLNNSLISALLDKDAEATTYKNLPNGARVLIDDIMYTKTSEGLTSDPTESKATQLNVAVNNGATAEENEILKLFNGTFINYSGRPVALTDYIKRARIGDMLNKDLVGSVMFRRNDTIKFMADKGGSIVNKSSDQVPRNVCINVVFDNNVKFTQIDSKNGVYTLALTTDSLSNGYINDISYFYETLTLDGKDDLFIRLTEKTFKQLDRAGEFTHKFKEAYKEALMFDTKNMLRFFLTIIIAYSVIMSWMCFAVVELSVGKNILLNIRDAFGKNNEFDLLRYLTFGAVSLDSEIKPYSLFLGNIGLFLLLYYVIERL
ncbi:hypothetical protein [Paraclostridium bifermentans]|uniref:hypothetical protein n=1 Tax=Paraclostridium bifermentans TaxID=1490 RepID=UPI00374EE970